MTELITVLLISYILSSVFGLLVYIFDVTQHNPEMPSLMKFVWGLTITYSGFVGLAIYWYSGRKQISNDSLYRRACRSTAHCYSGCGLGEVLGVTSATIYLGGAPLWIAIGSFGFAYLFGFGLTIGPLMQDGVPFGEALKDSITTETASITIMETAAVSMDLFILGESGAGIIDPLFWVALATSLTIGFVAAYPVNWWLINRGVKEGMMNPQMFGSH